MTADPPLSSTMSMYAPVVGGMSFVAPGSNGSTAQRVFMLLKSVRTILTPIEYNLNQNENEAFDDFTAVDMEAVEKLKYFYKAILNCTLNELFSMVDDVLNEARNILSKGGIKPIIEKWASTLIGSMFAITKIESTLIFEAAKQRSHESAPEKQSSNVEDIDKANLVVCRICDEHVPINLFEKHTESCIAAYQSEAQLNEVNQEILRLVNSIAEQFLKVDWPGVRLIMIEETIPMLQVYLLLRRAYSLDAHIQDASDDLATLQAALFYAKSFAGTNQIIKNASILIREKRRQCIALTNAASILRQTRLSGSDQAVTQTDVSIADFIFLKRISAGAYARVFLGQKKKTGDLYAIKVLPKNEMRQKNQVKRVLAERDILMQFNNPYIVNFCMIIFRNFTFFFFNFIFIEIN